MAGGVVIRNDRRARILSSLTRATARALTRAMQTGRTHATRAVAAELGTTQEPIRRRLRLDRASVDEGIVSVGLRFTGKRLPLLALGARQTKKGVTYRGSAGRELLPSGFIATMKSGHKGVFVRKQKARLPIAERYGASVPFVATKNRILESTLEAATAAFRKNAAHEVARAVSGAA